LSHLLTGAPARRRLSCRGWDQGRDICATDEQMTKWRVVFAAAAGAFLTTAFSRPARAIPAFTRKYETSCITCHVAPPKLNAFGRAFRNRGYRMPKGDADLIKQKQISLGVPAWKKVWPKAIWPADIPGGNYFAIEFQTSFNVNPSAKVTNEFEGIGDVSLLMGGTIGETASFFADLALFESGNPGSVGRAYIQYNHPSHWLNITTGQIQPRAQPFVSDLSVTGSAEYLTNFFPMISTGNFFGFSPHQKGIEFWGGHDGPRAKGGFMWSAGVVNGELGKAADELADVPELTDQIADLKAQIRAHGGRFDINSGKDFYFQGSYKILGTGVLGSGLESTLAQTNNWRDDSFTVGAYFYRGTTAAFLSSGGDKPVFDATGNTFYRTGLTLDWWFKDLNVFGGWQRNHDRLKSGRLADGRIVTAEANYVSPWPWIQPAARVEIVKPDFAGSFNRTTLSTTVLIRANMLLTFQGSLISHKAPKWPLFDEQFRTTLRFLF
jgi:hypothetical protein